MRHEGNVVTGVLEECDLDHDFSVVKVTPFFDVDAVFLDRALQFMPHCKVVSLGCDVSRKIMARCGKLSSDWIRFDNSAYLVFSSCKLPEVHLNFFSILIYFCCYMFLITGYSYLCQLTN